MKNKNEIQTQKMRNSTGFGTILQGLSNVTIEVSVGRIILPNLKRLFVGKNIRPVKYYFENGRTFLPPE